MLVVKEVFLKNKKMIIIIFAIFVIIVSGVIAGVVIHNNNIKAQKEQEYYNSLPMKVDISMTSYYGSISYIVYELGLDFDLVTMGANCYTGIQRNEFKTEKYGILHTEFRYCKSNSTTIFRVYNDEDEQPLREPKADELPKFDKYGSKVKEGNSL